MSARVSLQARVEQYLAERRKLGFALRSMGHGLPSFARYVAKTGHHGSLCKALHSDPYAQVATMCRRGALRSCDRGIARPVPKRGQPDLDIVFAHRRSCDAAGELHALLPLSTAAVDPVAPTTAIGSQQSQHLRGLPTVLR